MSVETVAGNVQIKAPRQFYSKHVLEGKGVVGEGLGNHIAHLTVQMPRNLCSDSARVWKEL